MSEIGYEGYLGYELCHQLPVVDGQTVDIELRPSECPAGGRVHARADRRRVWSPASGR